MSYSLDANLLLYASDEASPRFDSARGFLDERRWDPDVLCLAWPTLMAYLRIATHAGIFGAPLTPQAALANIEALLALPRTIVVTERDGFLSAYRSVTGGVPVRGNLVPDAHLATILQQNGVRRLYTCDRDFLRFTFLEVRDPLGSPL